MMCPSVFNQIEKLEGSFCLYCLFLFKSSIVHWVAVYEKDVQPLPVYSGDRRRQDLPALSYKKQMRMPRTCVDFPTAASLLLWEKNGSKLLFRLKVISQRVFRVICAPFFKKDKIKCCRQRGKGQGFAATLPPPDVLSSRSKQKWSYTWNFVHASFTSSNC